MIVVVSSGIRGGVGKSLIATVLAFSLNYLGVQYATLIVDAGGGSTRYVLAEDVPPPYTRDLPKTFNAIVATDVTLRIEQRRLFHKTKVEEKKVTLYVTPEVRELANEQIEGVVSVLPELDKYFRYVIVDLPAVSNPYYWRFLDVADVELVVTVPERTFLQQILSTTELRARRGIVIVVNKYHEDLKQHRQALEEVTRYFKGKRPDVHVLTIPYDHTLRLAGMYGIDVLCRVRASDETAAAIAGLVDLLEEMSKAEVSAYE